MSINDESDPQPPKPDVAEEFSRMTINALMDVRDTTKALLEDVSNKDIKREGLTKLNALASSSLRELLREKMAGSGTGLSDSFLSRKHFPSPLDDILVSGETDG